MPFDPWEAFVSESIPVQETAGATTDKDFFQFFGVTFTFFSSVNVLLCAGNKFNSAAN